VGIEPPAYWKRLQNRVGIGVRVRSPGWKPIHPWTHVAGVHWATPGEDVTTSIPTTAPALAAIVPTVLRVSVAARTPITANTPMTSRLLARGPPARPVG
jgi:hypothetical protein